MSTPASSKILRLEFIKKLCPELRDQELRAEEENFIEYIQLVLQIHERIRTEHDRSGGYPLLEKDDQHDKMKTSGIS